MCSVLEVDEITLVIKGGPNLLKRNELLEIEKREAIEAGDSNNVEDETYLIIRAGTKYVGSQPNESNYGSRGSRQAANGTGGKPDCWGNRHKKY